MKRRIEPATNYLVYSTESLPTHVTPLPSGLRFMVWRPSIHGIVPPGMSMKFAFWSLFHYLRIFRNRDFSITYIVRDEMIVHRSCLLPKYFRWPFMAKDDLQISSTFTDPGYRGKGLATIALQQILWSRRQTPRRYWYVTRENNPASIAVCTKVGFSLFGIAHRTRLLGMHVFGRLVICTDTAITH